MVATTQETTIWPPQAYNGKVRFDVWETQLKMYMNAKGITDEKQKSAALLQHIGIEMLEKIIDWNYPTEPETMEYKKLIKVVKSHCASSTNLFAMRVRLFNEKQKSGQSVQEYCAHMSQLLGQCAMNGMTPQEYGVLAILRGLESDALREFLMNTSDKIKTIESARDLAVNFDQNRMAAKEIKTREGGSKQFSMNVVGKGYECGYCGETHQKGKDYCPAKGATCKKCGRKDHFAKVCKSGRRQQQNFVEDDDENLNGIYPVLNVSSKLGEKEIPPIKVVAKLDGATVNFQYDTGAAVTVISKKVWHSIGKPRMQLSSVQLNSYNKMIPVIGQCKVFVEYGRLLKQQWVIVVPQGESLFGRNWIKAFNLSKQSQCNQSEDLKRPEVSQYKQNQVSVSYSPGHRDDIARRRQTSELQKKFIGFDEMHVPMQGKEIGGCDVDRKQREVRFLSHKTAKSSSGVTVLKSLKLQASSHSICDEDKDWRKSLKLEPRSTKQAEHTRKPGKLKEKITVAGSESASLREGVME